MAVTNSVCIIQTGCNKIIVTDSSDWDTIVPLTDVDTSSIEITYDGVTISSASSDYEDEFEITATSLGFSDNLKDGKYDIKVTYTVDDDEYTIEEEFFIICNIQCIVDTYIAGINVDNCDSCNKEKKAVGLDATLKLDGLEGAIGCGNLTKAQTILDWLNALLINYNCKNC